MNRASLFSRFVLVLIFGASTQLFGQSNSWDEFCAQFPKLPNNQAVFDRLDELMKSDSAPLKEKIFAYVLNAHLISHSGDLKRAQQIVEEAYQIPNVEKEPLAYRRLLHIDSIIAAKKLENQRCIRLATQCIELCNHIQPNDPFRVEPLGERGIAYQQEGRFTDALNDYEAALEICIANKLEYRMLQVRSNLGTVFNELKAFDKADEQFEIGLKVAERLKKPDQEVLLLVNRGNNALDSDRPEDGERYYLRALEIKNEFQVVPPNGNLHIGLGDLAAERHEHEKAKNHYELALKDFQAMQDKTGVSIAESRLAKENVKIQKVLNSTPKELAKTVDTQIVKLEKSVEAARERGEPSAVLYLLERLFRLYQEKGDTPKALATLKEIDKRKRKEWAEISRLSVNTLNEKQQAIERLNESNRLLWMSLIAIGLGSGLLFLVWYGKRLVGKRLLAANAFARDQQQRNSILQFQLAESEKAAVLSTMSSGVLHDFNNYLAAIASSSEVGLMVEANRKDEFLSAALNSCMSASNLSRQLFEFAGQGRPNPVSSCDVIKIVQDNQVAWRNLTHQPVDLSIALPNSPALFVPLSSTQMERIIINLLKNSSEAIGDSPGQIGLRISLSNDESKLPDEQVQRELVSIEIRDNGPGMDEQVLRTAVDPYFSTKGIGRGLGLASVKGMVERNNGQFDIESFPGAGTTVTLTLPRLSDEENHRILELRDQGKSNLQELIPPELQIVLVEDDETVLKGLSVFLETLGLKPVPFVDAAEALKFLCSKESQVDVVVTDFSLSNTIDGSEIAEAAKSQFPECRVLLMSGFAEDEIFQNSIFDGFLSKPFTLRELHQAIALLPRRNKMDDEDASPKRDRKLPGSL